MHWDSSTLGLELDLHFIFKWTRSLCYHWQKGRCCWTTHKASYSHHPQGLRELHGSPVSWCTQSFIFISEDWVTVTALVLYEVRLPGLRFFFSLNDCKLIFVQISFWYSFRRAQAMNILGLFSSLNIFDFFTLGLFPLAFD